MTSSDYTTTLLVGQSPEAVFHAINDIRSWWSEDFEGGSTKLNEEFAVRFGEVHYSRQKLTALIPGKRIVWLVTESHLNFIKNTSEWTGTEISFELSALDDKTQIRFTHRGLEPSIECYGDCSKGWNYYLQQSLLPRINTGKGAPHRKTRDAMPLTQ
jgi:hypothetical protein